MNKDTIQGDFRQLKGKIKQQWGKLTDDEIDEMEDAANASEVPASRSSVTAGRLGAPFLYSLPATLPPMAAPSSSDRTIPEIGSTGDAVGRVQNHLLDRDSISEGTSIRATGEATFVRILGSQAAGLASTSFSWRSCRRVGRRRRPCDADAAAETRNYASAFGRRSVHVVSCAWSVPPPAAITAVAMGSTATIRSRAARTFGFASACDQCAMV
jgi:hypothetical protein